MDGVGQGWKANKRNHFDGSCSTPVKGAIIPSSTLFPQSSSFDAFHAFLFTVIVNKKTNENLRRRTPPPQQSCCQRQIISRREDIRTTYPQGQRHYRKLHLE